MIKDLWVEKYRPKTVDDMVLEESIKKKFKDPEKIQQNILLLGHCGIGKSTLAKIIVNDILDCQYIYINASDENGIDIIRTKVHDFITTKSFDNKLKVVILEEFDGESFQAQQALRNSMEEVWERCIFILTANFSHKIIEPIRSRCARFDLKYTQADYLKYIAGILKKEGVKLDKDLLGYIKGFYPDFRRCLNELQKNRVDDTIEIHRVGDSDFTAKLIDNIKSLSSFELRKFILENIDDFCGDYDNLTQSLYVHILNDDEMDESIKMESLLVIGEINDSAMRVPDVEINFFTKLLKIKILWTEK